MTHETLRDFFYGIHTMFKAGYPISDCVALMAEEEKDNRLKTVLTSVSRELEDGILFSDALEHSGVFPSHTVALIRVGESVGKLEECIESVAKFHSDRQRIKKQISDAITYPLILVMLMLAVICVLLTQVIPVFNDVYASLGGSMTGAAGGILLFGQWLGNALPIIIAVIAVIAVITCMVFVLPVSRKFVTKVFYSIVGDSGVFLAVNQASFASALSMAASSGTTFEEGLNLASNMMEGNEKATQRIKQCISMIEEGKPLDEALNETKLLPASSCKLLKIGMQAGSGDSSMAQIADRLNNEANDKIADAVSLIEPTLVIITSFITGAILLTVMLPLINIMKVI